MLSAIKDALSKCPSDGSIYLIDKLSDISGFFMVKGHLLYMVYNSEETSHQNLSTEYLKLNTNIDIVSVKNDQKFKTGKYNLLEIIPVANEYPDELLSSFINLCISHTTYMNAKNFVSFFYSLISLFQTPKEQNYKNLVGFIGELFLLKSFAEDYDFDISDYWHTYGSSDNYDIVLPKCNIEIKTTSSEDELITIKHIQIFNTENNYLASIIINEDNSGMSLNELINNMLSNHKCFNSFNFSLNIEKEKMRVSPVDAETKRFILKGISIYRAETINPFKNIPDEISNLSYKMSLMDKPQVNIDELKRSSINV
jgi:putative uncharacterized protein MYPE9810